MALMFFAGNGPYHIIALDLCNTAPPMEHHDIKPMSDWLRDAEIAVEGVETTIVDA